MKFIPVLFVLLLNTLFVRLANSSEAESLQRAFNGDEPFFGVAVTRDVENNPPDYTPLSQEENYFIFCLLNFLYGNEVSEAEFAREIARIQAEKEERFFALCAEREERTRLEHESEVHEKSATERLLRQKIESLSRPVFKRDIIALNKQKLIDLFRIVSEVSEGHISKFQKDVIAQLKSSSLPEESADPIIVAANNLKFLLGTGDIDRQVKRIFEEFLSISPEAIRKEIEKFVQESFTENETHVLSSLEQYREIFPSFFEAQKEKFIQYYRDSKEKVMACKSKLVGLKSSWSLVSFNEMFFSKTIPLNLVHYRDIKSYLVNFSRLNKRAVLQVNFLKETSNFATGQESKDISLKGELSLYNELEKKVPGFFYSTEHGFDSWQDYLKKINEDEHTFLNVFENINYIYWNGGALGFYRKSSYRGESEQLLKKGYLYRIGHAKDDPFLTTESDPIIQPIVQKNMSTEICYDLELGVRKAFASYPELLRIHVVPSNTLLINDRNMINLPDNGSMIFHIDPEHIELLVKNKLQVDLRKEGGDGRIAQKYNYNSFIRKSPFVSLQIITDNNLYTFSFWRLDKAMHNSQ